MTHTERLELVKSVEQAEQARQAPDHSVRLWEIFWAVDSVKKLLDHSMKEGRLAFCQCNQSCFQDITGPQILLRDALNDFSRLLAELNGDTIVEDEWIEWCDQ